MSFGSDLLSLAPSAVVSGAGSLFGSALGQIGSAIGAKRQYKYNTKLMQQQHAYELENMSELERIQRGLAVDSSLLRRQALEKAGYNAADPEGTGTVAPSMTGASTSASGGFSVPGAPYIDTASGISAVANAQLTSSQARLNDIEAKYRAKLLDSQIEYTNTKIEQIRETLQPTIDNLLQDLKNKRKQVDLNDQQIQEIGTHMEQLSALTAGIRIDNQYKDKLNSAQINKLEADAREAVLRGDFQLIQNELAKHGIIVGLDWIQQLILLGHYGTGDEVLSDFVTAILSMIGQLPGAVSSATGGVVNGIFEGLKNLGKKGRNVLVKGAYNVARKFDE